MTTTTTDEQRTGFRAIHLAICDPGAFVERGFETRDGERLYESVSHWAAHAVQCAIAGSTPEGMLREFHAKFGHDLPVAPTAGIHPELVKLRQELLDEEVAELRAAMTAGDVAGIADGVADVVFVAVGTAVTYGLPFDALLAEVFRSNMTKTGEVGRSWAQGQRKLTKGPGYEPPDIAGALGLEKADA